MITCRFTMWNDEPQPVLWLRTRLVGYAHSRSNRRLMSRNLRRYHVSEGPLRIDAEHEALYQRYLTVARGQRPDTLAGVLLVEEADDHFDTRELSIRDDGGRLVGFSAFDVGVESLQSIVGVYDPAHRSASIGYWSLLLEVDRALEIGLRYHYAGYVLPGDRDMDYKLRVGHIEFFDQNDGNWRPWSERDRAEDPGQRLDRRLQALKDALHQRDVPARMENYRWFAVAAWSGVDALVAAPRVLMLGAEANGTIALITWDFDTDEYTLMVCQPMVVSSSDHEELDGAEMLVKREQLTLGADPSAAAVRVVALARAFAANTPAANASEQRDDDA